MEFKCYICDHTFTQKHNLVKHLFDKKCKGDLLKVNEMLSKLIPEAKAITSHVEGDHNNIDIHQDNSVHINIQININPITKLNLEHIDHTVMRNLVEEYDKDSSKLNLLLSEYMKNMLCDQMHPENQSVKYVKKKPPTFNAILEDTCGNITQVIKGLSDTCELLSDPMLNTLRTKLKECLKHAKKDHEFEYELYEDTFKTIREELNKDSVKKALKSVLQNDILNDIRMKFFIDVK